ncbi:RNA-binding protein, putative [Eimeria acervulina]|uniref:RNA-binding protein, putative n=1 Tax=Eimeria acervulina TaxID=5801 RepID=U6GUX2_EIMAC|nr:RNA-binding protein, putative [Eimeria acervulina]CDI83990.1 RNA-binding protein, putative [Eimeria acervulina]
MSAGLVRGWRTGCSLLPSLQVRLPVSVRPQQRLFSTVAPPGEAPSFTGVATEAFPFLMQRTAAEAAQSVSFGSLAASMTRSCEGVVRVIHDMDAFEAEVYRQPPTPLAIFFAATFNTHNKLLLEQFIALAQSSSRNTHFLIVDVDEVPRAAYHCGVEHPCTFVIQFNGDAFRKRITDPVGTKTPSQLISEFRSALDECLHAVQQPEPPQQRVEWYSHSIPVDNLNVYRVNWPTA